MHGSRPTVAHGRELRVSTTVNTPSRTLPVGWKGLHSVCAFGRRVSVLRAELKVGRESGGGEYKAVAEFYVNEPRN